MKKTILVVIGVAAFLAFISSQVASISRLYIGLLNDVPSRVGNVETYIERQKRLSDRLETMSWNEYRVKRKELLDMEIRYAEVGLLALRRLNDKGQLADK